LTESSNRDKEKLIASPDRKGKPSKRMGRKTAGLMAVNTAYDGWVAEVGIGHHLSPRFIAALSGDLPIFRNP